MLHYLRNTLVLMVLCGFISCSKSTGPLGIYRGVAGSIDEEITILDKPHLVYRHIVRSNNRVVCDEQGVITIDGPNLYLTDYTEYIDGETGMPAKQPHHYSSYEIFFLSGPEFDMLKPNPEFWYYLEKGSAR